MKRKWLYGGFTGLFVLICLVPALGTLVLGPSSAVANEAQVPVPQLKKPDGAVNTAFLTDAGEWFGKHFAFREQLITANSAFKAAFKTSSRSSVVLGKDGWLFFAETLDDYTGADTITPRQAFCAARSMKLLGDWVESGGGRFVCTVAPNKISLYPEFAPGSLTPADPSAAGLFAASLESQGAAYVDLFEALGGEDETLYHAADSHWTNRGAALAHDALLVGLGMEGAVAKHKAGTYQNVHQADLYTMLYPASPWLDAQFVFNEPLGFTYDQPVRGPDDIDIRTSGTETANGSLLMFRDSFGNALHPLMAESFAAARFTRSVPYDLMDAGAYGAVVLEIVERNIERLSLGEYLLPAPEVPFEETAEDPGAPACVTALELPAYPDYTRLSGQLPTPCDDDSPVYLQAAGVYYEAFPAAGDGVDFTVVLPAGVQPSQVLYRSGGQWQAAWAGEA